MAEDDRKVSITTCVASSQNFNNRAKELGLTSVDEPGFVKLLSAQIAVVEEDILVEEGYEPGLKCLGDTALSEYYELIANAGLMSLSGAAGLYQKDKETLLSLARDIVSQHHKCPTLKNNNS